MYLTMTHDTEQSISVQHLPGSASEDFRVQIFLGSSFQTLYMSVEEARQFAQDILAALPVTEPVDR
jgi:hypothetical protein